MSYIRWLKISEGLANCGHQVDIATNEPRWFVRSAPLVMGPNLRRVPLRTVRWNSYDVVKTLFHEGFETLERYGGYRHPFIISKLGSVVGPQDMEGVYFYRERRETLYATQQRIQRCSRFVTVLSEAARRLWADCFGSDKKVLLIPGGVDKNIPPPGKDPYPVNGKLRCLFAGTVYGPKSQPEANRTLVEKLSLLGKQLNGSSVGLYVLGRGDIRHLDRTYVTHLGRVAYHRAWDYLYHANVGVVVSAGKFMHNNESSKIYHYLRAGLPVVSESGFPNDYVVHESQCGIVVESEDMNSLAAAIHKATKIRWDKDYAMNYMIKNHTWAMRVALYDELLGKYLHKDRLRAVVP